MLETQLCCSRGGGWGGRGAGGDHPELSQNALRFRSTPQTMRCFSRGLCTRDVSLEKRDPDDASDAWCRVPKPLSATP